MDRPTLCADDRPLQDAHAAVDAFVAELQAGVDTGDAIVYNAHVADDVMWGSPYGATVGGYDTLHAIHRRLFAAAVAGPRSRYEKVAVNAPAPDVAVAQVRRTALTSDGTPIPIEQDSPFSEMALYVLVRRDGQWWLAAGQNTIIRPTPANRLR
ncbi:SgcJ/EcaC family oxidoreductase [Mycobacterium deserti]|uniref:SgcJ/EcaC family oxidoreductase n=1 Tax=Mycobacterium deserti TaxID=2978347 RepID=A0ABT2M4N6_9MYCO|nr:SgcJ/EcaC family oxidoreductase [Mycobacterium deserti]MCT7656891.1 SgcJ/EcaC family oxidoreductase [Mycobacterium deserti]